MVKMAKGREAIPSNQRQPRWGIMNRDSTTIKQEPNAQKIWNSKQNKFVLK